MRIHPSLEVVVVYLDRVLLSEEKRYESASLRGSRPRCLLVMLRLGIMKLDLVSTSTACILSVKRLGVLTCTTAGVGEQRHSW